MGEGCFGEVGEGGHSIVPDDEAEKKERGGEVMEIHREDSLTLKLSFSRSQLPQLLLPSLHRLTTLGRSLQSHSKVQPRRDAVIYRGSNDASE